MRKVLLLLSLVAILGLSGCFKRGPEITQTPLSIAVSTNNPVVGIGQSATITAVVYDQNSQGVQWSASPLNFGTLSKPTFDASTLTATVTYTAPSAVTNPAKVTVTATSITNPNISASVSFHFSPLTITLQNNLLGAPLAPSTLNPYDRVQLFAAVTNDLSNLGVTYSLSPAAGSGSLTSLDNFTSLYFAPTVSAPTTVVVTATSVKDPTVSASQTITILPSGAGPNVVILDVNGGPVPGHVYPNRAFTSIVLCNPGSTVTCQTIDGILVDTGSYGLRILDSQIALLNLPNATNQVGSTLENCASWPDGSFLWGPVSTADLYIGGEEAGFLAGNSVAIQVISSKPAVVPASCTNGATGSDNTPELLGANGILGIGPEPTDCTLSGVNYCDGSTQQSPPNLYYACPNSGCNTTDSPVTVNALQQVSNPIPRFAADTNGVTIRLPSVSDPQVSAVGTMAFGIGTESNNQLSATANILTLDANDNFTTIFNGQLLTNSFIDSGSSGLYFPDDSLPSCTVNKQFYCPTSPIILSATNVGQTGQSTVNFAVEDADSLLLAFSYDSVFPTFAGPSLVRGPCSQASVICVFDWGLPFFYGRTVYVAIDGKTVSNAPAPPWWAY